MRIIGFFVCFVSFLTGEPLRAQEVIPLSEKGGLHAAYVIPNDDFHRVDVQLLVLSGHYDDPDPSGTAHLTEHLAAFSADATILRKPRERDIHASINNVATIYTNSGPPSDIEMLLKLSRAVLDTPNLPADFAESEIDIIERETFLNERRAPRRWIRRMALQNLYGTKRGRANSTIEDLPNLSLEKAYQFHKEHYVPANVSLIVSGQIEPEQAADLVARIFGDTEPSKAPDKPWLDQKPDPALRNVERIKSDRLTHDAVDLVKFVDFREFSTSFDLQGEFFIASEILGTRLGKALHDNDERFLTYDFDFYFAKNADLEFAISVDLMPGFSLEDAHRRLQDVLETLLNEPITSEEIEQARQVEITFAQMVRRRAASFLRFLTNVAADGFPPVTPTLLAEELHNTSDQEVIDFATTIMKPSATAVILAQKVD